MSIMETFAPMRTPFFDYYREARAFTLVELLVTLAILCILAALSLRQHRTLSIEILRRAVESGLSVKAALARQAGSNPVQPGNRLTTQLASCPSR